MQVASLEQAMASEAKTSDCQDLCDCLETHLVLILVPRGTLTPSNALAKLQASQIKAAAKPQQLHKSLVSFSVR